MTQTTVGPAQSWRLVHDGAQVISLEQSSGYTTSIHTIFEASTEAACNAEAVRLGMREGSLVPQTVSFRQAKTQLQLAGLWDAAIAAASAIADPVARIKTVNLLLDSTEYERQRPDLVGFAKGALGLSDAQLDTLFVEAAKL